MRVCPFFMSQQVKRQKVWAWVVGTCLIDTNTHRDHRPTQR
jgi:hypothetical protein